MSIYALKCAHCLCRCSVYALKCAHCLGLCFAKRALPGPTFALERKSELKEYITFCTKYVRFLKEDKKHSGFEGICYILKEYITFRMNCDIFWRKYVTLWIEYADSPRICAMCRSNYLTFWTCCISERAESIKRRPWLGSIDNANEVPQTWIQSCGVAFFYSIGGLSNFRLWLPSATAPQAPIARLMDNICLYGSGRTTGRTI